jgi:hypothetical protein
MAKKAATKSAKPLIDELFGETPVKKTRAKKAAKRKRTAKAAPPAEAEFIHAAKPGVKITRVIKGVPIPAYPVELATKQFGDKTPAVLEWYEKNHPVAYAALVAHYANQ